jgi:hypothetical protein
LKSSRTSVRLISAKPSLKNPSGHQNDRNRSGPNPETPLEYITLFLAIRFDGFTTCS